MRTIENLKRDKEDLAHRIREAIDDFQNKNPDTIVSVEVESITEKECTGSERLVYYRVNVDVKI